MHSTSISCNENSKTQTNVTLNIHLTKLIHQSFKTKCVKQELKAIKRSK